MTPPTARGRLEERLVRLAGGGSRHVFTQLYPEAARAAADAADARARLGISLGPLDGALVSIKDLFDVAGEPTTAGSEVLRSAEPAAQDATVVRRLRRAGAVIIGKTNMSEFAFTGLGINPHHGTPGNAVDSSLIPGGSSSGAGVSVADGTSDISIGTDTGGSVRIPAALNGVVGYKPSVGRIPSSGAFPLSYTLDSVGPLARTVAACAAAAAEMAGEDPDPLGEVALPLARIGVPRGRLLDGLDPEIAAAFDCILQRLSRLGTRVVDLPIDDILVDLEDASRLASIPSIEAAEIHALRVRNAADRLDPNVLARIRRGSTVAASDYLALTRLRTLLAARADHRLAQVDGLILPTVPVTAMRIGELETDSEAYARANLLLLRNPSVANLLDFCAITLPVTGTRRPAGLMLFGRHGRDRELLDLAAAIEAAGVL